MNFIESIMADIGEKIPYEPSFKATLFGGGAGYFENVSSIKSYSPEEIILCVKRGGIIIRGNGMYIKKYCAGDVAICGKISSLEII